VRITSSSRCHSQGEKGDPAAAKCIWPTTVHLQSRTHCAVWD
jgi:hypothetical protein